MPEGARLVRARAIGYEARMPGFPPETAPPVPVRSKRTRARAPGYKTTEMWGKSILQAILVANVLFKLDLDIDNEFALALAGVLETGYAISRGISKRGAAVESAAEIRQAMREEIAEAVAAATRNTPQTVNVSVQKEPAS